uniref:Uncharacterized protein n=1 Tax=Romanomermis culicivorax TaxID=13658 RepID=A0A915KGC9_ROMCU
MVSECLFGQLLLLLFVPQLTFAFGVGSRWRRNCGEFFASGAAASVCARTATWRSNFLSESELSDSVQLLLPIPLSNRYSDIDFDDADLTLVFAAVDEGPFNSKKFGSSIIDVNFDGGKTFDVEQTAAI